MLCNGPETLLIFIFGTGLIGLMPVLSLRLGVLELLSYHHRSAELLFLLLN